MADEQSSFQPNQTPDYQLPSHRSNGEGRKLKYGEGPVLGLAAEHSLHEVGLMGVRHRGVLGWVETRVDQLLMGGGNRLSELKQFRTAAQNGAAEKANGFLDDMSQRQEQRLDQVEVIATQLGEERPDTTQIREAERLLKEQQTQQAELLSSGNPEIQEIIEAALSLQDELGTRDAKTQAELKAMAEKWQQLPETVREEITQLFDRTKKAKREMFAAIREKRQIDDRTDEAQELRWLAGDLESFKQDPKKPARSGWRISNFLRGARETVKHPKDALFGLPYEQRADRAAALEINLKRRLMTDVGGDKRAVMHLVKSGILSYDEIPAEIASQISPDDQQKLQTAKLKSTVKRADFYIDYFKNRQVQLGTEVNRARREWLDGSIDRLKNVAIGPAWLTEEALILADIGRQGGILGLEIVGGHAQFKLTNIEQEIVGEMVDDLGLAVGLRQEMMREFAGNTTDLNAAHAVRGADKYYQRAVLDLARTVDRMAAAGLGGRLKGLVSEAWMRQFGAVMSGSGDSESKAAQALKARNGEIMAAGRIVKDVQPELTIQTQVADELLSMARDAGIADRFWSRQQMEQWMHDGWRGLPRQLFYTTIGATSGSRDQDALVNKLTLGIWDWVTGGSRAEVFDEIAGVDRSGLLVKGGMAEQLAKVVQRADELAAQISAQPDQVDTVVQLATLRLSEAGDRGYVSGELRQMQRRAELDKAWEMATKATALAGAGIAVMMATQFGAQLLGINMERTLEQIRDLQSQFQGLGDNIQANLRLVEQWTQSGGADATMTEYAIEHAGEQVTQSQEAIRQVEEQIQHLRQGQLEINQFVPQVRVGLETQQVVQKVLQGTSAVAALASSLALLTGTVGNFGLRGAKGVVNKFRS